MEHLIIWFYCLNPGKASLIVLGITALLVLLCKKTKHPRTVKAVLLLLLCFWAAAVLHYTLWSRTPSTPQPACWLPLNSYLDVLLGDNPERLRSNYMNVLLFYPAGVLLAALLSGEKKHPVLTALGFLLLVLFSAVIEATQFHWGLGLAETDDVIHNTLGAVLGFYVFALFARYALPLLNRLRKK